MFGDTIFRRYQAPAVIIVFGLVIFTFIFWGMGDPAVLVDRLFGVDQASQLALGAVGGELIAPDEYGQSLQRQRAIAAQRAQGEEPSNQELWQSGAAMEAFDQVVNAKLLQVKSQELGLAYDKDFLTEQLKEDPFFQTESGEFNAQAWNDWVTHANANWPEIYERTAAQINRTLYVERIMASARTLESELRRRFERENTELVVRYVAIEAPYEPPEEDIQAQYDEDPMAFASQESRVAEFVIVPLTPDRPAEYEDLLIRAQNGEELQTLASLYGDAPLFAQYTQVDWTPLDADIDESLEPLRELGPGELSRVIQDDNAYMLYRVLEERQEEDGGPREVRAGRLTVTPRLTPEERSLRLQEAQDILAEAKALGTLKAATLGTPYSVVETSPFNQSSAVIVNVPSTDTFTFRRALSEVEPGGFPEDVVAGRSGIYVPQVTEIIPPQQQPLEDVRGDIIETLTAEYQQTPAYQEELAALGERIAAEAESIEDVQAQFGEHVEKSGTTSPFTVTNWRFENQILWNARDVFDAVGRGEPGAFGGPISDFSRRALYFVELVSATPPAEEVWEERWQDESDAMKNQELQFTQAQRLNDYMLWLRSQNPDLIQRNDLNILRYLGLDTEPAEDAPDTESPPLEAPTAEGK